MICLTFDFVLFLSYIVFLWCSIHDHINKTPWRARKWHFVLISLFSYYKILNYWFKPQYLIQVATPSLISLINSDVASSNLHINNLLFRLVLVCASAIIVAFLMNQSLVYFQLFYYSVYIINNLLLSQYRY